MFMHWPDETADHPDTIAEAGTVTHGAQPDGIAWLEVGGEAAVREWLGPALADMDVRFVDRPAGLYAVGIRTEGSEIVIRRLPVPLSMARHYNP
jgi:hypothetical protein